MVKVLRILWIGIVILCSFQKAIGQTQNVQYYTQFNGRYDFTFIGNTMNLGENNVTPGCADLLVTSSAANLNLTSTQIIQKAYLYWAGSGTGDLDVLLNGIPISSQRTFATTSLQGLDYFSCFADVTNQLLSTGNGTYTLSDLDISQTLNTNSGYCNNRTNFAGWAIIIVYKDNALPLNQINIYDGLQNGPNDLIINLSSLNVLDTNNSKVGFISWEGDAILATESFYFNGNLMSNPPLNPANNVFNGTNSITGSTTLYNMDLDIYPLQGFINIGDSSAQIRLSSTQDFIMINAVVTKLNNQLPDATIAATNIAKQCDSKVITVSYTVSNLNSTNSLPANTPIAFYANGILVGQSSTTTIIPINGSENGQITLTLPNTIASNFDIKLVVDDNGTGVGIVPELVETNNSFTVNETLWVSPTFNTLEPLYSCNLGFTKGIFDFSTYEDAVKTNPTDTVHFYETNADAVAQTNPIVTPSNYVALTTPKEIFVRIDNANCSAITSFILKTKNCPPTVYNYISANNDGQNDVFFIEGLRNIFLDYKIEIYSRWGRLLWTGNQNDPDWNGYVKDGIDQRKAPDGTYFYFIFLNDLDYPEPLKGFLYLNH